MPSLRRQDGLIRFGKDNTSQSGEDGIISRLFSLIDDSSGPRWCVDVGAWDGKHLSNTYSLLHHPTEKWSGLLIEADAEKFNDLCNLYKDTDICCIQAMVSCIPSSTLSLSNLLKRSAPNEFPQFFDFLCIDVDGTDYWLMHDVLHNSSYRAKVIVVEFNPTMPHDLIYIQPRNDKIRNGSSISAVVELAEKFNYQLVETTCYNAFFVDNELYHKYVEQDIPFEPTITNLHEITMGTSIYQLYDGTLKLHGCKKLLWHRLPIREDEIQVLKHNVDRLFPFAPGECETSIQQIQQNTKEDLTIFQDISVDISSYCEGGYQSDESKRQCADALLSQLQSDGFALIRGTGISQSVCSNALSWTHKFLQDAPEAVRRSTLTKDRARRGYAPQNTENFASLIGDNEPNDLVRKFRIGLETGDNFSLTQPNAWPTNESWGEESATRFQKAIQEYYDAVCLVAHAALQAICDGLNIEDVNTSSSHNHTSILTLLGYRKGSRHQGKHKRPLVAAHSDVGSITVLLFDAGGCATLQRSDGHGGWIDVNLPQYVPNDPIFVINVGDCLSDIAGNGESLFTALTLLF